MWLVVGAAAALVASAVGVATAGDGSSAQDAPGFFPEVTHEDRGPGDPRTFHPVFSTVTLDCVDPDADEYLLRYTASAQPGVQPTSEENGMHLRVRYRNPTTFDEAHLPMLGDAISTGDAPPAEPGWIVVAGETVLHVGEPYRDIPVEVSAEIVSYEPGSDRGNLLEVKNTTTRVKVPEEC